MDMRAWSVRKYAGVQTGPQVRRVILARAEQRPENVVIRTIAIAHRELPEIEKPPRLLGKPKALSINKGEAVFSHDLPNHLALQHDSKEGHACTNRTPLIMPLHMAASESGSLSLDIDPC